MMKIIFSELADADMQDILEYIAQDDLERAVSFTLELEEQIEKLSDYPYKHPPYSVEEYGEGVRVLHYHGYRVLYEVESDTIYIHEVTQDRKQSRHLKLV